jgi:hypothetical protein
LCGYSGGIGFMLFSIADSSASFVATVPIVHVNAKYVETL